MKEQKEIDPKQGTVDLQVLINNLDQRGLLVLQVLLGQRAIQVLESEPTKAKVPFLKPTLLLPGVA